MHILIAMTTVLLVIGLILWRNRSLGGSSGDRGGAPVETRSTPPPDRLDDPRLVAAGMMNAIALMDGALTRAQIDAVRVECRAAFRVAQVEADEIAAYGRRLAAQFEDPMQALERLAARLHELAPVEARRDMIKMLERVASVENGVSPRQRAAIAELRGALGVS